MTADATARRYTQKLQRAIVDGLEDVKAQDIRVFNTEHLSPLFERVILATGTSNRQTKALAASVRDAVRDAGFAKPRIEGEEVGEWIIVDCGAAVAHIMQPAIRQYYQLEDIWGDKPVRLRLGAAAPAVASPVASLPTRGGGRVGRKVAASTEADTTSAARPRRQRATTNPAAAPARTAPAATRSAAQRATTPADGRSGSAAPSRSRTAAARRA